MHHSDDLARAFAILGLQSGASASEIRHRHKALAKRWHPDRWASSAANEREAAERMREINWAAQVLAETPPLGGTEDRTAAAASTSTNPHPDHRLTEDEKREIVDAIGPPGSWGAIFGFVWWALPLLAAGALLNGRGAVLARGERELPPTTGDMVLAGALALLSLAVVIRQRRNGPR